MTSHIMKEAVNIEGFNPLSTAEKERVREVLRKTDSTVLRDFGSC